MVAFFAPVLTYVVPTKMIDVIKHLGLQSGLKLCLDAGDAASYTSGQVWSDLSGGGYDFNRGTTSGAQASDPTFNGVAGGQSSSEYWSFDGGDFFTYDTTNETWMQNIHKNGAKLTIALWYYAINPAPGTFEGLMGTSGNLSSNVGFYLQRWGDDNTCSFDVNGGVLGQFPLPGTILSTGTFSLNAWNFIGFTLDEATGAWAFRINGTENTGTNTYASPSAASSTYGMMLGGNGGVGSANVRLVANGTRFASVSVWEGAALTATNLLDIYNATRTKFGV